MSMLQSWLAKQVISLVMSRTRRGVPPLHVACGLGHFGAVAALIAAGSDVAAPSPFGLPREIAEKEGHLAAARLLPGSRN